MYRNNVFLRLASWGRVTGWNLGAARGDSCACLDFHACRIAWSGYCGAQKRQGKLFDTQSSLAALPDF